MPWGPAIGAAVSVAGNALTADKKGGAGSSTSDKSPWANAQPLLVQTLNNAYGQQAALQANPLSAQQTAAYDNSYALSDYVRGLAPSLLSQQQGQPLGYDPRNPSARPTAYNFAPQAGGLGRSVGMAQAPAAAPAPAKEPEGTFTNQDDVLSGMTMGGLGGIAGLTGKGGYGEFTYGMEIPKAGTKAYRDMTAYFANGGADPNGYYSGVGGATPYSQSALMSGARQLQLQ